jgi:hypothetical protein
MTFICLAKKKEDGYMKDNTIIHEVEKAIVEFLVKPKGCSSMVTKSRKCTWLELDIH